MNIKWTTVMLTTLISCTASCLVFAQEAVATDSTSTASTTPATPAVSGTTATGQKEMTIVDTGGNLKMVGGSGGTSSATGVTKKTTSSTSSTTTAPCPEPSTGANGQVQTAPSLPSSVNVNQPASPVTMSPSPTAPRPTTSTNSSTTTKTTTTTAPAATQVQMPGSSQ